MAKIAVNRITNANVYINGTSFLGRCEEVDAPVVKNKTVEHKALGLVGIASFWAGIEKIEARFKWSSLYPEVMTQIADPFKVAAIQVRGSLNTFTAQGLTQQQPVVAHFQGMFRDFEMGKYKQQDNAEFTTNMDVNYCKMVINGLDVLEIDVLENIYKINGVDALAQYRINLGA